jgi:hypothetical protein
MGSQITNLTGLLLQPAGAAGLTASETALQTKFGVVKFHSRPNIDAYVVEVKGEPTKVSGTFFNIESTVDHKPSTATSALGLRGLGGIGRLAASYTMTGGSIVGTYGQACNLGTVNGSGAMIAGLYGLLEDGGTFTALSHIAAAWLDTHLTKTITAGIYDLLYMTNNGTTQVDNAIYIYAGNKITNLFTIDTASGMVGDKAAGDYTFSNTRKIKVVVGGETGYLVVDIPS